jgi:uncharacterized protein YukE
MPQVIVDPEELRRFASDLKVFNDRMRDQMATLRGRFRHLGETWRDQEQQRFAQEFDKTVKVLDRFVRESETYISFLRQKARPVDQYLRKA